ncbi:MAG: 4'-phosphopantetheinyl transferase superfamily protein [Anaerovorax sp.]|nr:4'-phosphopantetheinyl transferase superfamily protein [Anaerovorax sp.]
MYLYYTKNIPERESRDLLYQALKKYGMQTGIKDLYEKEIIIREGLHGKPYISQPYIDKINFSVSHSKSYWVCLIDRGTVGIDIEDKYRDLSNERILRLAKRFFAKQEYAFVREFGNEAFYQVWVRKEAFIKCKGTGISENLKSFSVIDEEGEFQQQIEGLWMNALTLPIPIYSAYCCKSKETEIQIIENF